jgi:hypothetical protein
MRIKILAAFVALIAYPAYSTELPTAGTYDPKVNESGFRILPTITWVGRETLLKQDNGTLR